MYHTTINNPLLLLIYNLFKELNKRPVFNFKRTGTSKHPLEQTVYVTFGHHCCQTVLFSMNLKVKAEHNDTTFSGKRCIICSKIN